MYHLGDGGITDYGKAMEWYLKAANQSYVCAQYDIGIVSFSHFFLFFPFLFFVLCVTRNFNSTMVDRSAVLSWKGSTSKL